MLCFHAGPYSVLLKDKSFFSVSAAKDRLLLHRPCRSALQKATSTCFKSLWITRPSAGQCCYSGQKSLDRVVQCRVQPLVS